MAYNGILQITKQRLKELEEMKQLKEKGLTYKEIAYKFNISRQRIQQLLRPKDKIRKIIKQ